MTATGPRPTLNILFELGAEVYAWFTAQEAWRASCARMAAYLPASVGNHRVCIVDLGCGPGVSTFELARLTPGGRLVGLDQAGRMLREARRRARRQRRGTPITWIRADAARLPFRDGSVDAFTGHSFLYLLADQAATLAEVRRALRPGGRLVLMEPSAAGARLSQVMVAGHGVRFLVAVVLWRPFSRLHGPFTPASLRSTLEGVGLASCQVEEVLGGLGLLAHATKPGGLMSLLGQGCQSGAPFFMRFMRQRRPVRAMGSWLG